MRKRLGIRVGHVCMCVLRVLYLGERERVCLCVCVLGGGGGEGERIGSVFMRECVSYCSTEEDGVCRERKRKREKDAERGRTARGKEMNVMEHTRV